MPSHRATLLLATLLAAAALPVAADIGGLGDRLGRPPAGASLTGERPLRADCWQGGQKIFQQEGVTGLDLGSVLREQSISLRRRGDATASAIIVPVDETVCIISDQP